MGRVRVSATLNPSKMACGVKRVHCTLHLKEALFIGASTEEFLWDP